MTTLTPQEAKVYRHLKHSKSESYIMGYVKDQFQVPTVPKVRFVINQLISQGQDNKPVMCQMLGFDIFEMMQAPTN